jgi:hypothetical protein
VPPAQTTVAPAAHASNLQLPSPARPFGHESVQLEPAPQLAWQLPSRQSKSHVLPGPQLQLPFEHSPLHAVCAWQLT